MSTECAELPERFVALLANTLVAVYARLMGVDFACVEYKEGMTSKETYHGMAC